FKASKAPCVLTGSSMDVAIEKMDKFSLGAVIILDKEKKLKGIITDGDIRHYIATNTDDFGTLTVDTVMSKDPHALSIDSFLYEALNLMEKYQITVLPIVDKSNKFGGLLHLHDILGKGSFQFNGGSQ
ncbi:MAG: CBS domain-containing protein, partial [Desulfobacula sp.]|nr:CBS domain-containing protein [Desulfobacula sp.]